MRTRASLRVAVLMGGVSSERDVSLRSGEAVARGLAGRNHEVQRVPITTDGDDALSGLASEIDAVFLALHGRWGEDGVVQRRLDALGIAYTGSGPGASARAFDKALTRAILSARGIPVPRGVAIGHPVRPGEVEGALRSLPPPPLVVKPTREGSSIGVSVVKSLREAEHAVEGLRALRQAVLIEAYVPGRELTVSILEDETLPPIEIVPRGELYDYDAKYDPASGTRYELEPHLPGPVLARARALALASHRALGCRDLSRVDLRIDPRGEPFVLEVNTIPGFTETSLFPKAAARAGLSLGEVAERLVRLAIARRET